MKRLLPLMVPVLLFWLGCTSAADKRYFQLHIPPPSSKPATPALSGKAYIPDARVDKVYEGYRLVYRYSPYQLDYYNYEFWIKKPGRMISESMAAYFGERSVFSRVTRQNGDEKPDWIIASEVTALEEFDQPKELFAHLAMKIRVIDTRSGNTVMTHSFNRMDRLARRDSRLLPLVLSEILRGEFDKLTSRLRKGLSE